MNAELASLPELLAGVRRLERRITDADASARLTDSVVRPLTLLVSDDDADPGMEPVAAEEKSVDAEVWELALAATRLRSIPGAPALLIEATAALQDLTCRLAPHPEAVRTRIARLADLQSALPASIQSSAVPRKGCPFDRVPVHFSHRVVAPFAIHAP